MWTLSITSTPIAGFSDTVDAAIAESTVDLTSVEGQSLLLVSEAVKSIVSGWPNNSNDVVIGCTMSGRDEGRLHGKTIRCEIFEDYTPK